MKSSFVCRKPVDRLQRNVDVITNNGSGGGGGDDDVDDEYDVLESFSFDRAMKITI